MGFFKKKGFVNLPEITLFQILEYNSTYDDGLNIRPPVTKEMTMASPRKSNQGQERKNGQPMAKTFGKTFPRLCLFVWVRICPIEFLLYENSLLFFKKNA